MQCYAFSCVKIVQKRNLATCGFRKGLILDLGKVSPFDLGNSLFVKEGVGFAKMPTTQKSPVR